MFPTWKAMSGATVTNDCLHLPIISIINHWLTKVASLSQLFDALENRHYLYMLALSQVVNIPDVSTNSSDFAVVVFQSS